MQTHARNQLVQRAEALADVIDLRKLVDRIKFDKWLVIITTLVAFTIGLAYFLLVLPIYSSSTLIQVNNRSGGFDGIQEALGSAGSFLSASGLAASPSEIEIALINSRFVLQPVIEKLNLNVKIKPNYFPLIGSIYAHFHQKDPLMNPPLGLSNFPWGGEKLQIAQFEIPYILEDTKFNLKVEHDGHYKIYTSDGDLLVQGEVGKLAQSTLDSHPVKIFITKIIAHPGASFTIIQKPMDEIIDNLSSNLFIMDLGNNRDKSKTGVLKLSLKGHDPILLPQILNTIIQFTVQNNINKNSAEASKTLDFLNKQIPIVRKNLDIAETNLNEYRAKGGTMSISQEGRILLASIAALERSKEELRLKKIDMLQEFTPNHPFIITTDQKREQLDKEIINLKHKVKMLPKMDQKAFGLERDVRVKSQLYLVLLNKIQQLEILKAGTLGDIRVLSLATMPIQPISNNKKLIVLIISPITGFVLAIIFIFLKEMFKYGVSNPEIVEERLGVTSYAIIPYSRVQKQIHKDIQRKRIRNFQTLAQLRPKDPAIEAMRNLRTALQLSLMESKTNNIISIMGANPNIGKSFVSINLSQVLADTGKRVLLIDGDMRKGKCYQYLTEHYSPGFSDLLIKTHQIGDVVRQTSGKFDFIPTGKYPKSPSEILLGHHLKELLTHFSKRYDMVIIDTPPILAVTDGILLAQESATNLLVIDAGNDHLKELEWMMKRVRKNGIEIHGLVFNNKIDGYQSYYGEGHYYYSYETEMN